MGYVPELMTHHERMEVIRDYVLALSMEQGEMLDELPWKPWKNYKNEEYDLENVTEEWIDSFIFLMDQAIILGITADDIENMFTDVMRKLFIRIENRYSKKREKGV